jgi:hypothetical protein
MKEGHTLKPDCAIRGLQPSSAHNSSSAYLNATVRNINKRPGEFFYAL